MLSGEIEALLPTLLWARPQIGVLRETADVE